MGRVYQRKIKLINQLGVTESTNKWYQMIKPILTNSTFVDDKKRTYKVIDSKLSNNLEKYGSKLNQKWGQVLLQDQKDNSYWRIGFRNLHKRNLTTTPDSYSYFEDCLVLTKSKYHE